MLDSACKPYSVLEYVLRLTININSVPRQCAHLESMDLQGLA